MTDGEEEAAFEDYLEASGPGDEEAPAAEEGTAGAEAAGGEAEGDAEPTRVRHEDVFGADSDDEGGGGGAGAAEEAPAEEEEEAAPEVSKLSKKDQLAQLVQKKKQEAAAEAKAAKKGKGAKAGKKRLAADEEDEGEPAAGAGGRKRRRAAAAAAEEASAEPAEPAEGGEGEGAEGAPAEGGEEAADEEGAPTAEDEAFIDDEGAPAEERWGGEADGGDDDDEDGPGSPAPEAEEARPGEDEAEEDDEEFDRIIKDGKPKRRTAPSMEEVRSTVENFIVRMEVAAERDEAANREGRPAIAKLRLLAEADAICSRRALQEELLNSGLLTVLAAWLRPLPDGTLPNINVRGMVLRALGRLPIDLDQPDRREQMKKSGLGKVVMFLTKSDAETRENRRAAQTLIEAWMRPIYELSTRFEDLRRLQEAAPAPRRPRAQAAATAAAAAAAAEQERERQARLRPGDHGYRYSAAVPKVAAMEYTRRPQAREEAGADEAMETAARGSKAKEGKMSGMARKLEALRKPIKKNDRAMKPSIEGRGMHLYL